MPFPTIASAGTSDEVFIRRLREFTEDLPLFAPEQASANGTSTEYRFSQFPIYDGDSLISLKAGATGTTAQTLNGNRADLVGKGANQASIDYETGWVFWDVAPVTGTNNIQFRKSKVRWRNEKMLEALYAGLHAMFPRVWQKCTDTSITLQTLQWDYTLPTVFSDPRVRLYAVEVQEVPAATQRFRPLRNVRRVGPTTLHIPGSQGYPPGSTVRLSYAGPYQSLGDLEPQLEMLPLLYAKGYLLSNKEIVRVRFDQATVTQNEQANPPGVSQNAGQFFFTLFDKELQKLARPMPMPPAITTWAS